MEHRILGRTGVSVSKLALGTMMFGPWGNPDHDASITTIQRAIDAGINFIDTADVHSAGESEIILGKALTGRRDDVGLATKVNGSMGTDPNRQGNSRRWIIAEVENSLRRLGTDYTDLYQIHRPSPTTDIDETLSALTDLVRQGKVRYIGGSTFPASQIVEAQWVARDRNLQRFVTEQPPYSILVRGAEADVFPTVQRHRIGVLTYSPLAGGWLSGLWRKESTPTPSPAPRRLVARFDMSLPVNQRKLDIVDGLARIADGAGITLIQLAIAFALNRPETLTGGISVNVTLIFSPERYEAVINAYIAGVRAAKDNGEDISQLHAVASFFVSQVDAEIDKRLEAIGSDEAKGCQGQSRDRQRPGSPTRRSKPSSLPPTDSNSRPPAARHCRRGTQIPHTLGGVTTKSWSPRTNTCDRHPMTKPSATTDSENTLNLSLTAQVDELKNRHNTTSDSVKPLSREHRVKLDLGRKLARYETVSWSPDSDQRRGRVISGSDRRPLVCQCSCSTEPSTQNSLVRSRSSSRTTRIS